MPWRLFFWFCSSCDSILIKENKDASGNSKKLKVPSFSFYFTICYKKFCSTWSSWYSILRLSSQFFIYFFWILFVWFHHVEYLTWWRSNDDARCRILWDAHLLSPKIKNLVRLTKKLDEYCSFFKEMKILKIVLYFVE